MQRIDATFDGVRHTTAERWPRNERRMLVEVDVISQGTSVGEQPTVPGKQRMLIYKSQLAETMAKVRKPEAQAALDRADQTFQRLLAEHVAAGGRPEDMNDPVSPFALASQDPLFKGGFGPLRSCVVITDDVEPPPTTDVLQSTQFEKLANTLEKAFSGNGGAKVAELEARIAHLTAQLERVLKQKG